MKRIYLLIFLTVLSISPAYSMHIMEGFLSLKWCLFWAGLSLPFLVYSCFSVIGVLRHDNKNKLKISFASAFIFILSALRLPSVAGSSTHLCGTTLGVILLGPGIMPFIGFVVLLFHALLLGHGGISTLGANIFSMFIVGPWIAFGIYKLLSEIRINKKYWSDMVIFISTFVGSMSVYLVASFQLAMDHHGDASVWSQAMAFFATYCVSQVPLSILEGIFTVSILYILSKNGVKSLGR